MIDTKVSLQVVAIRRKAATPLHAAMSKAPSRIPSLARPSLPAPLALAPQPEAAAPSAAPHEPSEPQQSPPQAELSRDGSVRVAVRVRPLLPRELATSDRASVRHPTSVSIELPDAKRFTWVNWVLTVGVWS